MLIESTAPLRVSDTVPSELRTENLQAILDEFGTFIISDNVVKYRNIDYSPEQYLDLIQEEIAKNVPDTFTQNRIKLFKRLIDFYGTRGSRDSIELFFRIVFNADSEVYYPREDIFIPSDLLNSHVSSNKKLRDARYYQEYSYVIRTDVTEDIWGSSFQKLIHPAGFEYFGEFLDLSEISLNLLPINQDFELDDPVIVVSYNDSSVPLTVGTTVYQLQGSELISGTIFDVRDNLLYLNNIQRTHRDQIFIGSSNFTSDITFFTADSSISLNDTDGLLTGMQLITDTNLTIDSDLISISNTNDGLSQGLDTSLGSGLLIASNGGDVAVINNSWIYRLNMNLIDNVKYMILPPIYSNSIINNRIALTEIFN